MEGSIASVIPLLYLMVKPPTATAHTIHRLRGGFGISDAYGPERFHVTLLPLGDSRMLGTSALAQLREVLASVSAGPFPIAFLQLDSNALRPARSDALRMLQRSLVDRLKACGLPLPAYRFRPHLSLAYGEPVSRRCAIPPLGWTVDALLLVESLSGAGRHKLLGHWPLVERQHSLDFWSADRDAAHDERNC